MGPAELRVLRRQAERSGSQFERGRVPELRGFERNEEERIRAVILRSGLPTTGVSYIYKYDGLYVPNRRKRSGRQIVDGYAIYNYDGSIGLSSLLLTQYNEEISLQEAVIHEIAHSLSPAFYKGTDPGVVRKKMWTYQFATPKVLNLLDRVNNHCVQNGRFVSFNHLGYYRRFAPTQNTDRDSKVRLYDETFTCLMQTLFCKPYEFAAALTPEDAGEFMDIARYMVNCSQKELLQRIEAVRIQQYH